MDWKKTFEEAIRERRSCRSYADRAIETSTLEKLKSYLDERNRANEDFRFVFLNPEDGNGKVGSYGMVTGAKNFIAGIVQKKFERMEEFGIEFEKIILFATSLGLGTCWLAGINRRIVNQMAGLSQDELVAVASPVGYAKKIGLKESLIRRVARADKKKPWEELFFDGEPGVPLPREKAGKYALPLEMVRLAPSGSNKQPWRVIMDEKGFHFCLARNKGYGAGIPFDIQRNDIGIAMCHFEGMALSILPAGKWVFDETIRTGGLEYIRTWSVTPD